jgi:hypothetical protein
MFMLVYVLSIWSIALHNGVNVYSSSFDTVLIASFLLPTEALVYWRMPSSGVWRRVDAVDWTDVSEDRNRSPCYQLQRPLIITMIKLNTKYSFGTPKLVLGHSYSYLDAKTWIFISTFPRTVLNLTALIFMSVSLCFRGVNIGLRSVFVKCIMLLGHKIWMKKYSYSWGLIFKCKYLISWIL